MIADKLLAEKISLETHNGYWACSGHYFFNKQECMKFATARKDFNITFHLFDAAYGSLDWTKEPTYSIDTLYEMRAKQIRDKYDYVIVMFSGGADSGNVLDSFLNNNVHIDEIVSYYPLEIIDKNLSSFNPADKSNGKILFEYKTACEPRLKEIAKTHPNIKITILDYGQEAMDAIIEEKLQKHMMAGIAPMPINQGHVSVTKLMKERSEKYNKVCCVTGTDKPRVMFNPVTRKFGSYFADTSYFFFKTTIDGYQPKVEWFYHTPDLPEITYTQSHMIKRVYQQWLTQEPRPTHVKDMIWTSKMKNEVIEPHTPFMKKLLYKNYNVNLWQADKSDGFFYTAWFHSGLPGTIETGSRADSFYEGQLKEFQHGIDRRLIRHNNRGTAVDFESVISKVYWF